MTNTHLIKVQVLDSMDGDQGVSFNGMYPTDKEYFPCSSVAEALKLKDMVDHFVDLQIMNLCPNPWGCPKRLSMSQIQTGQISRQESDLTELGRELLKRGSKETSHQVSLKERQAFGLSPEFPDEAKPK
jgi:hypothetical protein